MVRAQVYRDSGDSKKADEEMRWFVRTYTQRDNDDKPIKDPDDLLLVGLAGTENARAYNLSSQFKFILTDLYVDILKFDPNAWQSEYQAGMLLLEKYNKPEADLAFDKALKINPNAAEALTGKGLVAFQQYEMKDAENFAESALKINPKLTMALRLKADVLYAAGEFTAAVKSLDAARAVNHREESTLARLAACYQLQHKADQYNETVAEAEKYNKKPGEFYFELGHAFEDRRVYGPAEECFRKAIDFRENLAAPKSSLGLLLLRIGKEEEGKKYLDKAFELDRFNVRVANSIRVMKHLEKYETIETPHYIVKFDPKADKVLAEFMAEYLEQVHAELKKDFQFEPKGKMLFEVFSSHEIFSGRTVALPDLHTVGACTGRVVTMASPRRERVAPKVQLGPGHPP